MKFLLTMYFVFKSIQAWNRLLFIQVQLFRKFVYTYFLFLELNEEFSYTRISLDL